MLLIVIPARSFAVVKLVAGMTPIDQTFLRERRF